MEVLQAAGTKWNFLPFRPGLVGGHCIGVDPYYLTHKAEMVGYHPEVILAGRRINDGMGKFVAEQTVKHLMRNGCQVKGAQVIVLGLTFKENCPDLRNSRVIDMIRELQSYGADVRRPRSGGRAGRSAARVRRRAVPWERPAAGRRRSSPRSRINEFMARPLDRLAAASCMPRAAVIDRRQVRSSTPQRIAKRASRVWRL